jgi:peptide/nickel transport system substrate-binding protein
MPSAQLALAGTMIANAVYDTLTVPTRDPQKYAPYLAKDVQPNATYDQWTISLRPGVKFQDGTPVDAAAVKKNIDAWRTGTVLQFMYGNIANVTAPNVTTVVVTMKTPWVAFPAWLWNIGRVGIAAPAQLDAGAACATKLIGSGPFKVTHFDPSTGDVATTKNRSYWRAGFPYLDHLNFKISAGTDNRLNGLQGGQFDIMSDSSGASFDTVKSLPGITYQLAPAGRRELGMVLLNVSRPPLDDLKVRTAVVEGTDRQALNEIANKGNFTLTNQVVDKDVMGYLKHPGFPKYDPKAAKKTVAAWKHAHGGKSPSFDLQSPADEMNIALSQEIKRQMAAIGIKVNLPAPVDQATIISQAIGNQVDSFLWRNYAGGDPDTLYPWFESGSPLNFNKIDDPLVDAALAAGRSQPDATKRAVIYAGLNRRLSTQAYNLYTWYENWYVAEQSNVKGVLGPNLPDADGKPGKRKPVDVLAGYHQVLGLWLDH